MNFTFRRPLQILLALGLIVVLSLGHAPAADEHAGEHPGSETEEHAGEKTRDQQHEKTFSADEIKTAIRSYIETDQTLKHGYFYIYDETLNRDWKLTFSKLHPVRIIDREGKTIYFACTNFAVKDDKDHKVLDLDFWMKPEDGELRPYKIRIHKVDGKARFTYENDRPVEK